MCCKPSSRHTLAWRRLRALHPPAAAASTAGASLRRLMGHTSTACPSATAAPRWTVLTARLEGCLSLVRCARSAAACCVTLCFASACCVTLCFASACFVTLCFASACSDTLGFLCACCGMPRSVHACLRMLRSAYACCGLLMHAVVWPACGG